MKTSHTMLAALWALSACGPSYMHEIYGNVPVQRYEHRGRPFNISDKADERRLMIDWQSSFLDAFANSLPEAGYRDAAQNYLRAARPGCAITDGAALVESVSYGNGVVSEPIYEFYYAC